MKITDHMLQYFTSQPLDTLDAIIREANAKTGSFPTSFKVNLDEWNCIYWGLVHAFKLTPDWGPENLKYKGIPIYKDNEVVRGTLITNVIGDIWEGNVF